MNITVNNSCTDKRAARDLAIFLAEKVSWLDFSRLKSVLFFVEKVLYLRGAGLVIFITKRKFMQVMGISKIFAHGSRKDRL